MKITTLLIFLSCSLSLAAQKFFTKSARVSFYSKAKIEDIEAINKTGAGLIDAKSGTVQFIVLIKGFEFIKALMQEHFNENYMESDKFPKSEFRGTITNNNEVNYTVPGTYNAKVKGQLTIHGITKPVEVNGTIKISDKAELNSEFQVLLSDYNIAIPSLVKENISKNIKVSISAKLDPLKE